MRQPVNVATPATAATVSPPRQKSVAPGGFTPSDRVTGAVALGPVRTGLPCGSAIVTTGAGVSGVFAGPAAGVTVKTSGTGGGGGPTSNGWDVAAVRFGDVATSVKP